MPLAMCGAGVGGVISTYAGSSALVIRQSVRPALVQTRQLAHRSWPNIRSQAGRPARPLGRSHCADNSSPRSPLSSTGNTGSRPLANHSGHPIRPAEEHWAMLIP